MAASTGCRGCDGGIGLHHRRACAGLIGGPALWALNMQVGQILPYPDCAAHLRLSAALAAVCALLALGAAGISWRARSLAHTQDFVARLGALAGLVFAFALLLQAIAGIVLTGCER